MNHYDYRYDRPFEFKPRLIDDPKTSDKVLEQILYSNIPEVRKLYNILILDNSIKYIELDKTVKMTQEETKKVIYGLLMNGIKLKWYAPYITKIPEGDFEYLRSLAKKKGSKWVIQNYLS